MVWESGWQHLESGVLHWWQRLIGGTVGPQHWTSGCTGRAAGEQGRHPPVIGPSGSQHFMSGVGHSRHPSVAWEPDSQHFSSEEVHGRQGSVCSAVAPQHCNWEVPWNSSGEQLRQLSAGALGPQHCWIGFVGITTGEHGRQPAVIWAPGSQHWGSGVVQVPQSEAAVSVFSSTSSFLERWSVLAEAILHSNRITAIASQYQFYQSVDIRLLQRRSAYEPHTTSNTHFFLTECN